MTSFWRRIDPFDRMVVRLSNGNIRIGAGGRAESMNPSRDSMGDGIPSRRARSLEGNGIHLIPDSSYAFTIFPAAPLTSRIAFRVSTTRGASLATLRWSTSAWSVTSTTASQPRSVRSVSWTGSAFRWR